MSNWWDSVKLSAQPWKWGEHKDDIKNGKGVAEMGTPLHGLSAGYKGWKLMSPTVHMKERSHDLRTNGVDGHLSRSRDDFHHYGQEAFKENWPVLAVGGANIVGGLGAGGGGGAAGGGSAPVVGGGGVVGAGAPAGIETVTVTGSQGSALPGLMGAGAGAGAGAGVAADSGSTSSWRDWMPKGGQQQQQQQQPQVNPWLEQMRRDEERRREEQRAKQMIAALLAAQQRRQPY